MADHFGALGLDLSRDGALSEFFRRIHPSDTHLVAATADSTHYRWLDESGAGVSLHIGASGEIECATPFFDPVESSCTWLVRRSVPWPDPECRFCGAAQCEIGEDEGSPGFQAVVDQAMFLPDRQRLDASNAYRLAVAGFVEQIDLFTSKEEFHHFHSAKPPAGSGGENESLPIPWATDAFLPVGMFGPPKNITETSVARIAGRICRVERRRNRVLGGEFVFFRLGSAIGELNLVAAPDDLPAFPEVDQIAWAACWLVGRPANPGPEQARTT